MKTSTAEDVALAAIVQSSELAVISKTIAGVITSWNRGAEVVYGGTAKQMLGQNIELMFPVELRADERSRHAEVAKGVAQNGYHCRRLRIDGRSIDVAMSMSPMRDGAGQVVGIASISRPVSDQERADGRFAALLEAAPDAMLCIDLAGRIMMANAQATQLFGFPRDALLGAPLEMLLPEDVRDRHAHHRAEFACNPRARRMGVGLSLSARRQDGTTFPVEISLAADDSGDDLVVIAAIRDVTEQRATEAAVRSSEARLRQLAERVDTVFILLQLAPRAFLYVSPAFERVTGRLLGDLNDAPDILLEITHADDRGRVLDYFQTTAAGEPVNTELRIVRADGEIRWVRVFASPVPNPYGPPERIVIAMDDVTERVAAIQALRDAAAAREANDAKNVFLSRMSHELRTPLNAVLGFGQLLERRLSGTDDAASVGHILKAGRHLLDLINEVLDIARIDSGELSLSLEPIHAAALIEETVLLVQPLADHADVQLCLLGGPSDLHTLADRQRLRQVLLNLLSNAIKYNHRGGTVWISWSAEESEVSITVRDNGRGIDAALHDRLFTPFDRLDAETTGVEGTGVGLSVTRALVDLMNGAVTFRSSPGSGTSFTVTLPTARAVAEIARGDVEYAQVEPPVMTRRQATLLYVEDNDPNVRLVEGILQLRPGWHMLHASLGSLGVELARAHRPDLILLDLHLPDGFGLDVLRALKADPGTAGIPVMVLSADANPRQAERLVDAGAEGYLAKPLDLDATLRLLDDTSAVLATGVSVTNA